LGYGGIYGSSWFSKAWKTHQLISASTGISIAWQELFAIVVAAALWGSQWRAKRILFWCDNASVVAALKKCTSPKVRIMTLIRTLLSLAWEFNFEFAARHVAGTENLLADPLSRLQVDLFRQRAQQQRLEVDGEATPIPEWLLRL
jgi:hypothetical protein